MKRLLRVIGSALCVALLPFITAMAATPHLVADPGNGKPGVLFTQTAEYATVRKTSAKHFILTLHNVNKHTLWFTDRPGRKGGTLETKHFVKLWEKGKDSFTKDNPNANLVFVSNAHGVKTTLSGVFKLSNPSYNKHTDTISYDAQTVYETHQFSKPKTKYQEVVLFIDDFFGGFP